MIRLSDTTMPFGEHKGLTFDEIPLPYLDWLSGQSWLYGSLRTRLTKYINHPVIERELDNLFIDKDIVTTELFTPSIQTSRLFSLGKRELLRPDWRTTYQLGPYSKPIPKTYLAEDASWKPIDHDQQPKLTCAQAWDIIADAMILFEGITKPDGEVDIEASTDPRDLIEFDFHQLKLALAYADDLTYASVKAAYIEWRKQLKEAPFFSSETTFRASLLEDALRDMKVLPQQV